MVQSNPMTGGDANPARLLAWCREAAQAAGEHALRHRPRRFEIHQRFDHDVKLELDLECQAVATGIIHGHDPGATILGEEGSSPQHASAGCEWIIDPIDGTVNYFHGLSWWCSSVAVRREGRILAGVVMAPEVGMCFDAVADGPARLNERPISVSAIHRLADALAITGSEKEIEPGRPPLATAQTLAPHVQKIRILGAAALDLCQVAAGSAELFFQNGLYIWDIAAAGLIVERAGGTFSQQPAGVPGRYRVLAANRQGLADEVERIWVSQFGI